MRDYFYALESYFYAARKDFALQWPLIDIGER